MAKVLATFNADVGGLTICVPPILPPDQVTELTLALLVVRVPELTLKASSVAVCRETIALSILKLAALIVVALKEPELTLKVPIPVIVVAWNFPWRRLILPPVLYKLGVLKFTLVKTQFPAV